MSLKSQYEAILQRKRNLLGKTLEKLKAEIITRTTSGLDYLNQPFTKYSTAYEKVKAKTGRSTTPNLTYTGQMLRSIFYKTLRLEDRLEGRISFMSEQEAQKARFNMNGGRAKRKSDATRKFFKLSKEQKAFLYKVLKTKG